MNLSKIFLFVLFFLIVFSINAQIIKPSKRILIFSKNASWAYRHASIEHGVAAVKKYCESKGFQVDVSEDATLFNDKTLSQYATLVFLSANQDIFDADQEAALQRYIRAGGGFAGIHSSTGVERNWSWFSRMIGATFVMHPPLQNGNIKVVNKKHPSTKHLPAVWNRTDEWYYFGPIKNPVKVLMVLDSSTFKSDKHTQNYPSAWYQDFEGGKTFYTAGGHNDKDFDDPLFMKHIFGGIQSTMANTLDYSKNKAFEKPAARIVTLDPGHFHAALVQKTQLEGLNPKVSVYAPESADLTMHLDRIKAYNNRKENPTHWQQNVVNGDDFFEKMIAEKKGDIVVMSGNNGKKTDNILKSIESGLNVLADKPMCINAEGYEKLKKAFAIAKQKDILLYDIMTERSEITTALQREFSMMPEIFGTLKSGSLDEPAIVKESVHHFFKTVSGSPLIRPQWFMDTEQQGEGVVDVTTHLVDLVQWAAYPETPLAIKDAEILKASRWATKMTLPQFSKITGASVFPDFLQKNVKNDELEIFSNGEINFKLRQTHAKVKVIWNYSTDKGGDTHYSIMKGTKSDLEIKQTAEENFVTQLYINSGDLGENTLKQAILNLQTKYPGIAFEVQKNRFKIIIPDKLRTNHEAHFGEVMERFLKYYTVNNLPDWEVPNMLLKYYITTRALEMAGK